MRAGALLIWACLTTSLSAQATQLVDGPRAAIARTRCLSCHAADLIVEQRLSRAAWDREIAKMERWSTQLSATEREQLLAYLAENFGLTAPPAASDQQGEGVYQVACLTCHEHDMTAQQRLSRAGWGRTVDKMVRWGAKVTAEQREPLVAYLATRYGPR